MSIRNQLIPGVDRTAFIWLVGVMMLCAQDAGVDAHLAAAAKAEQSQEYATASEEYRRILASHPNLPVVHQRLGLTYHLQNAFDRAIPEFQQAIKLDRTLWGSYLFLGVDYYKTNQFEKAVAALDESVKLNQQAESEARFWLGAADAALGRRADAIREYQRAAELRPTDVEVLYQLARLYDEEASARFARIGEIEPHAAAVYLLQAERYLNENRAELAGIGYDRAIALRPDYRGAIPALDHRTERTAVPELPVSAYDAKARAQLAERRGGWPWMLEARDQAAANHCAQAIQILGQVLQKDLGNVDALLAMGKTYKRWAVLVLQQMVEINPDSYRVHQLTGDQQEEQGAYEEAIHSYQRALVKQPDAPGLYFAVGNVYWKMRQYDAAEHWLTEELKRNPHHELTRYRLGSLQTELGKADEAIANLREAIAAHPEWSGARFDLGRALVLKGRYEEAVADLQKVAAEDPENDRVHYVLANAYRKMGRAGDADSEMAKYQELTRKRLDRVHEDVREASRSLAGKP